MLYIYIYTYADYLSILALLIKEKNHNNFTKFREYLSITYILLHNCAFSLYGIIYSMIHLFLINVVLTYVA